MLRPRWIARQAPPLVDMWAPNFISLVAASQEPSSHAARTGCDARLAKGSQEVGRSDIHQFEIGFGHEELKALLLILFDGLLGERWSANEFAMLFRRRDDFRDRLVKLGFFLAATQTQREGEIAR